MRKLFVILRQLATSKLFVILVLQLYLLSWFMQTCQIIDSSLSVLRSPHNVVGPAGNTVVPVAHSHTCDQSLELSSSDWQPGLIVLDNRLIFIFIAFHKAAVNICIRNSSSRPAFHTNGDNNTNGFRCPHGRSVQFESL